MRILYIHFMHIWHMMQGFQEHKEPQYLEDPQMRILLKMTNDVVMKIKQKNKV